MAMMTTEGRRCWITTRFGEPCVAALKKLGCHWDAESRRWWISSGKKSEVEAVLQQTGAGFDLRKADDRAVRADQLVDEGRDAEAQVLREAKEDVSACRVYAQVEYKGRRYYVIAETKDLTRCRLTTLDGDLVFWADCCACNLIRRYEGREVWDGRRYSSRTVTKYQTVDDLRAFRDRQKNPETARHQCPECGSWCAAGEDCRDCGGC